MIDLALLNKAILLTQKGNFEEAEKIYKSLLEQNPENGPILSAFGLFYVNLGDFEKASVYLQKACQIKETLGTVSALGFVSISAVNLFKHLKSLNMRSN